MKHIILSIILALTCLQSHAQNIMGSHTFRIGDKVTKQIVENTPERESSENRVWDLRDLSDLDEKHKVVYTDVYNKEQLVAGIEKSTRHYYEQRHDSLVSWGYENNLTKVEYDSPVLLLKTPLVYGTRHDGLFHGIYSYCEKLFGRIFGEYQVSVDGTGMMLLPSGDTLRHVSRVHVRELKALHCYPLVTTEKELRAYVDSLPFTNDSVRMAMTADSLLAETNYYRWYAAGYRYPILEVVETGQQGGEAPSVAYYCAPEEQETLYDEENEKIREQLAALDRQEADSGGNNGNGQNGNLPSALSRYDVTVNGQTITIDYDLSEGATVKGLVCNVQGMLLRQQAQNHPAGEHYQMQLDCTGLRRGEYVLYLNVNGQVTSSTVSW